MKPRNDRTGPAALLAMLVLILDGKTAMSGAAIGIELCMKTLIPSLFPFFLLSVLLTGNVSEIPMLRPLGKLLGIPAGGEYLLVSAFLGGYPVGAQAVAQACRGGAFSKQEAERLLGFCSNAGPAFLFGVLGRLFPNAWMVWALWGIHVGSAMLVSLCFPGVEKAVISKQESSPLSVPRALNTSIGITANVCGWVILFRVVMGFAQRWFLWLLPETGQVLFLGILELSNGCLELGQIENTGTRFVLCSGLLALGGLCVAMQTASVTEGLSLKHYYIGKGLQCLFSVLIALGLVSGNGVLAGLPLGFALMIRMRQKNSSIPRKVIV